MEELEEDSRSNDDDYDDDVGMNLNIDDNDDSDTANLTGRGPIKGEKVPEMRPATPPKISSVEEAVATLTRVAIQLHKNNFGDFFGDFPAVFGPFLMLSSGNIAVFTT